MSCTRCFNNDNCQIQSFVRSYFPHGTENFSCSKMELPVCVKCRFSLMRLDSSIIDCVKKFEPEDNKCEYKKEM